MIGFNALGQLGRLGNQMFQFAALKGIARQRGFNFCFPPSANKNEWTDHQLLIPFKLSSTNELNIQYIDFNRPTIQEKGFGFDEDIFHNCPDWVTVQGFFQTEKYFKHIEQEIKSDFTFRDEIYDPCKEMMSSLDDPIALHIRRTDYMTNPNHTCLSMDYYEKALEFFPNKTILIFSDDPQWCQRQELFADDRFLGSDNDDAYIDMCLMTMCKGHIIANSSFSWWGAWLADSDKVIAPKGWFEGSNNSHLDTNNIYCSDWIVL